MDKFKTLIAKLDRLDPQSAHEWREKLTQLLHDLQFDVDVTEAFLHAQKHAEHAPE